MSVSSVFISVPFGKGYKYPIIFFPPINRDLQPACQCSGGKRMERKVLAAMKKAGKPVRPGDVAKMIGEESKEVSKIISGLKKQGKVMSPKRCYYAPTEK